MKKFKQNACLWLTVMLCIVFMATPVYAIGEQDVSSEAPAAQTETDASQTPQAPAETTVPQTPETSTETVAPQAPTESVVPEELQTPVDPEAPQTSEEILGEAAPTVGQPTLQATQPINATYGNFELVLPTNQYIMEDGTDKGDGVVSNMNAWIYIKADNTSVTSPFNYLVTVYGADDSIISQEVMQFTFVWSITGVPWDAGLSFPFHVVNLPALPPGSRVTVSDIAINGTVMDQWGGSASWGSTSAGVYLTNFIDASGADISDEIKPYDEKHNPILLVGDVTRTIKYLRKTTSLEDLYYQTPTDLTFESAGNHFANGYADYPYLDKLLNSFNVFSFDDIEGEHIVGPIAAQNAAYYTRETPVSSALSLKKLIFADFSRGIPSYVKNITARGDGGRALACNYIYDLGYDSSFAAPLFYTSTSTKLINRGTTTSPSEYVVIPDSSLAPFLSPNNTGLTPVHHSDNYINFDTYATAIVAECDRLAKDGSIENFDMSQSTFTYDSTKDGSVLNVEPGQSWNIVNADNLEQINIIVPEGTDYFHSSSSAPLTLNFLCDKINPAVMGGLSVSQFPLVTFNGEEFVNNGLGEYIEFNEYGNKIIYNMPNIVTDDAGNNRVVTLMEGPNIPGHLLMPRAEFWNYQETTDGALAWEGGNINGLLLAKDVHVGRLEMHMWAYNGRTPKFTEYALSGLKTVNGAMPSDTFSFELNPVDPDQAGLVTKSFPFIAESDNIGRFDFQRIVFDAAGVYRFTVKEVIPANTNGVTYDKSEYELTVTVTESTTADGDPIFITEGTVRKVKDEAGNPIDPADPSATVPGVSFDNKTDGLVFPGTGGAGHQMYTIIGLSFLLLAAMLFIKSKKKIKNEL